MTKNTSPSPTSVETVRRLLARDGLGGDAGVREAIDGSVAAAALQRTCARVSSNLREAIGEDGWTALLARAVARAEADHPMLRNARHLTGRGISLEGMAASVNAHGVPAVTAAIEAVLASLIDVLGRLIGEDMAIRLLDRDNAPPRARGGGQPS